MKSGSGSFNSEMLRRWVNFLAIVAAFLMNIYANVSPPNGVTIGEIANTTFRNVLILPANYAFAIWGLIYLGLFCFGVYHLLPAQQQNSRLSRGGYLITLASLAQIAWVFLFQYRYFGLSVPAMLVILGSLIALYQKFNIGKERVGNKEKWLVYNPISIYLAWISVATIVNVASALYAGGWNNWGIAPEVWTIIMLLVGAFLGGLVTFQRPDVAFNLVFVWAFVAIAIRQAAVVPVVVTAAVLAVVLGALALWRSFDRRIK